MDMEQWISVGIVARERWPGLNGQTAIGRCKNIRVVVPFPREEIVLETLRLGSGEWVHIGYGELTNSLWIRDR